MAAHALLNAFKANKTAFGVWLTTPSVFHARTIALASPHLSWIMIDCEHGLVPLVPGAAEIVGAVQGTAAAGGTSGSGAPSVVVRVPATGVSSSTSWQIKYALDSGARGILVPMVSTVEKAKEIVSDSRFPPLGRRGFGSPYAPTTWGVTSQEYLKAANESVLVMVQIETIEGVQNVEAIAAVDGIDVLFVGPYDLSIAMGYAPPSPDPHPEVEKVIQQILNVAHSAGKKCAIYCNSGTQSAKRAAEGFDMINVISDVGALTGGIASHLKAAAGQ